MCMFFSADDKPFREGKERSFFKVLWRGRGFAVSPIYHQPWRPGINLSNRPGLDRASYEDCFIDKGIHVFLTEELAYHFFNEELDQSDHVVVRVIGHDDDCVMVSADLGEAVFLKVTLPPDEYERATLQFQMPNGDNHVS